MSRNVYRNTKGIIIAFLLIFHQGVMAQLAVVEGSAMNMTPLQLVQNYLIGSGITVSNATYNGSTALISSNQIGTFMTHGTATTQLGLTAGILMTSGKASIAIGPNNKTGAGLITNGPADPDLNIISSAITHDKAVLEFDFIPQSDTVRFRYVFGSEEFLEFCNQFNDAFGFFLSGPGITGTFSNNSINIALMPGTNNYVTINNICNNPNSRWDNPPNAPNFQYDALTHVFRAWSVVVPCSTYHIKLAVADAVDGQLDSGVFLEKNSFSSPGLSMSNSANIPAIGNVAVEGCNDVTVSFHLSTPLTYTYRVHFSILGNATNGIDYSHIPDSVTFLPGHDSVALVIHPLLDLVPEGPEGVIIRLNQVSCNGVINADTIGILDYTPLSLQPLHDTTFCYGNEIILAAVPSGGLRPLTYLWNINPGTDSTIMLTPPVGINNYNVTVSDRCNFSVSDTSIVTVHPVPVADAGPDVTIPNGTSTTLHGTASAGYGNYGFYWESNPPGFTSMLQDPNTGNLSFSTIYNLVVTDVASGCQSLSDEVMVIVAGGPLTVNPAAQPDTICLGDSARLYSLGGGGSGIYTYNWTSDPPGFTSTASNPEIVPTESTTYFVTINDGFNQLSGNTRITVNPLPQIRLGPADTAVCIYDSVTIDAGNPGSTYQWSNGATTRKITFMATGIGYEVQIYKVIVTNQNHCKDSASISVTFDMAYCTGMMPQPTREYFTIIPNPSTGTFLIRLNSDSDRLDICIYNLLGEKVFNDRMNGVRGNNKEKAIDVSFLSKGIYIIQVTGDHFSTSAKIIIQ